MTWTLVMTLVCATSVQVQTVDRLPDDDTCQRLGRAWVAQVNHREGNTDTAIVSCVSVPEGKHRRLHTP